MKKTGILNSDIARVLSLLGHKDKIVICDCGLPIPDHVERIDISLELEVPRFIDVLNLVLRHQEVERVFLAKEIKDKNKEIHDEVLNSLQNINKTYVSHEEFKKLTNDCKAIIRTGEATPYANIILESGVLF